MDYDLLFSDGNCHFGLLGDNALADVEFFFEDEALLDDQDLFQNRDDGDVAFDTNCWDVIDLATNLDSRISTSLNSSWVLTVSFRSSVAV